MALGISSKKAGFAAVFGLAMAAHVQADNIEFSGTEDIGTADAYANDYVAVLPAEGEGGGG